MEDLEREINRLQEEGFSEYEATKILLLTYGHSLAHIVKCNYKSMPYRQEDAFWLADAIIKLEKISTDLLIKGGKSGRSKKV